MANGRDTVTIAIHRATKDLLDLAKSVPYETYDETLRRLLSKKSDLEAELNLLEARASQIRKLLGKTE